MCLDDSRLLPSFLLSPCVHIHPLRDTSLCLIFFTPVNLCFSFLFIRMSWSSLARGADPHAMCLVLSFWGFVDGYSLSLSYSLKKNLLCCCFTLPLGPVFTTAPRAAEGLALSRSLSVPLRCKAPVCSTCAAWPAILILPRQLQMMQ